MPRYILATNANAQRRGRGADTSAGAPCWAALSERAVGYVFEWIIAIEGGLDSVAACRMDFAKELVFAFALNKEASIALFLDRITVTPSVRIDVASLVTLS